MGEVNFKIYDHLKDKSHFIVMCSENAKENVCFLLQTNDLIMLTLKKCFTENIYYGVFYSFDIL